MSIKAKVEKIEKTAKPVEALSEVAVRFAGDSGDGVQLAGTQFTTSSAVFGNDISTFPDYPAEIRAPAGSLAGVSGFQINFSSHEIHTPGDRVNALVALNPAALKTNVADVQDGGIVIVNEDAFDKCEECHLIGMFTGNGKRDRGLEPSDLVDVNLAFLHDVESLVNHD